MVFGCGLAPRSSHSQLISTAQSAIYINQISVIYACYKSLLPSNAQLGFGREQRCGQAGRMLWHLQKSPGLLQTSHAFGGDKKKIPQDLGGLGLPRGQSCVGTNHVQLQVSLVGSRALSMSIPVRAPAAGGTCPWSCLPWEQPWNKQKQTAGRRDRS